jgi:serine phosphatase RsbU (regulator of sigma subunit)
MGGVQVSIAVSNVITRKAISLLAEGVRDGAAARAASDYLFTYRAGKVQSTLNILSFDLDSNTMVITRNNPAPVLLIRQGVLKVLDERSDAVGSKRGIKPFIVEIPLEVGQVAVLFSDGLTHAGDRAGKAMDPAEYVRSLMNEAEVNPQVWADQILQRAVDLDDGHPSDDICVVVAAVLDEDDDGVRRLTVRLPI